MTSRSFGKSGTYHNWFDLCFRLFLIGGNIKPIISNIESKKYFQDEIYTQ